MIDRPAVPCAKYRLSVWLKIENLEPGTYAPYVKLAVSDAEDKWIDNYGSGKYDMKRVGEWQRLEALADVPANARTIHLAVEKGAFATPIEATIRLDDVKLELLEAP